VALEVRADNDNKKEIMYAELIACRKLVTDTISNDEKTFSVLHQQTEKKQLWK